MLSDVMLNRQGPPQLEEDEQVILEGQVVVGQRLIGASVGPLILTDRRIVWYEPTTIRPLKPSSGDLRLSDIESVDRGTLWDFVDAAMTATRCFRLRLRSGRDKCLWITDLNLNEWIEAIRSLIAEPSTR
jgi:hypothetical protein